MKLAVVASALAFAAGAAARRCHCLPQDPCWPSQSEWDDLNVKVNGRLVEVVPIGAVCHDPTYDEAACEELKANWDDVKTHYEHTSSLMTMYPTGQTCDPFAPREEPCTIGNYNEYTVDAETEDDIIEAIKFAKRHNIRFVIRNTGHDFWGRSIGHGALAVRMANFKNKQIHHWHDSHYEGTSLKMGAGNMGFEAQEFLEGHGLVMVAGYCSSVGPAGGYVQGGGHSPLSSNFGMAADQTLEFEVITAEGVKVRASRDENPDLFWALNGGGAGTWGVVTSMTVRVYPMMPMAGAQMFILPALVETEKYWNMVDFFYSLIPSMTDKGAYITYAYASTHFVLFPVSLYNATIDDVKDLLKPFTDYLAAEGIVPLQLEYKQSQTYMEHVNALFATSQPTKEWPSGGRLMPREVLQNPTRRAHLVSVMRQIVEAGAATSSTSMHPVDRTGNSVSLHPAWRDADSLIIMTWPWENNAKELMQTKVDLLTELSPLLIEVAPESGSYSNEADIFMPEWRHEMYGPNWEQLLEVKQKWDPRGFFYSAHTPGADMWHIDENGRMCRARGSCDKRRDVQNGNTDLAVLKL